jgi:thioredoxin-related protein
LAVLLLACSAGSSVAGDTAQWGRDLEAAKKAARDSGKDLLIVFTGHGWCHHCNLLDAEVFQQTSFLTEASKEFVFVEFDFNFADTKDDKAREARYRKLQEQFLVRSFPTVILADADGKPYAEQSGYAKGVGPAVCLAMMRVARGARAQRDREFGLAAAATGAERARHLHDGVRAVAKFLGSMDDRGDDPVLVFYRTTVQDILTADAPALRAEYEARQKKRDEWVGREAAFTKLHGFTANKDYRGALRFIDEQLKKADDRKTRWRLELERQTCLEWDGQFEEALKNARRLPEHFGLSADDKEMLLDREAFNLHNLNRVEELVAAYERRIAAAKDNPKKRLGLLKAKAEWLGYHGRPELTVAAWRECREAAKVGSDDWLTATAYLAQELRKAGQHRDALKVVSDYLASNKSAWLMLDAAESQLALGDTEQASAMIRQAQAASAALRKSTNKLDIDAVARIDERVRTLREQLDTKRPQ